MKTVRVCIRWRYLGIDTRSEPMTSWIENEVEFTDGTTGTVFFPHFIRDDGDIVKGKSQEAAPTITRPNAKMRWVKGAPNT